MQRLITAKELAVALNLPLQRVYELTRRHAIPAVRLFRQYRYDADVIDQWIKLGGVSTEDRKGMVSS